VRDGRNLAVLPSSDQGTSFTKRVQFPGLSNLPEIAVS
jgi:hypothetical protein